MIFAAVPLQPWEGGLTFGWEECLVPLFFIWGAGLVLWENVALHNIKTLIYISGGQDLWGRKDAYDKGFILTHFLPYPESWKNVFKVVSWPHSIRLAKPASLKSPCAQQVSLLDLQMTRNPMVPCDPIVPLWFPTIDIRGRKNPTRGKKQSILGINAGWIHFGICGTR